MGRVSKSPNLENKTELVFSQRGLLRGTWVAQPIECLPSPQVMIPGSWDPACIVLPTQQGACLSLFICLLLPLLVLSLSLSNK